MRNLRWIIVAATLGLIVGWPDAVSAAEEGKAGADAVRLAKKQLRSPIILERAAAVERLRDLPALTAVKLIVPSQFTDPAAEVRCAAYETLLTWKDDREVCVLLLKSLKRETLSKKGDIQLCTSLMAVLVASELPETQDDLSNLATSRDGIVTVTMVADELGRQGGEQALTSLQRMSEVKCFARSFAYRRAVVQAMIGIRLPQAVEHLIMLLPRLDGQVRGDVVRHLAAVSGQQYGNSAEAWQAWWKGHKERFEFPAKTAENTFATAAPPGTSAYYGLEIQARRMVFVLDNSGTMNGPRLVAAKRELINTIDGLPGDAAFNIVVFNTKAMVWQRKLMPATPDAKRAARYYIDGLPAGGYTAAYDALEEAFRFDTEAIYFLSDGQPNRGKIPVPEAIVAAISQANLSRRISIYTIGIAPGVRGGASIGSSRRWQNGIWAFIGGSINRRTAAVTLPR